MDFQKASTPSSIGDRTPRTTSLNDRLDTNYVDLGEEESLRAQYTKIVTGFVGEFVTPRQLLVVLRVLRALTFVFLIFTLAADMMYIIFLEILATPEVRDIVGGRRDMIIRVYGFFLAGVAIAIEVDVAWVVKSVYGFKGFLARSFLLFFISCITGANPLYLEEENQNQNIAYYYGDDVAEGDDDGAASRTYMYNDNSSTVPEVPMSVVVFQRVTSFILGTCAIAYFVAGLLCLDRFTSKAYLSSNDPLVTTAIPQPISAQQQRS
mmetsp:Transcript_33112/g.37077  ORF Transcript_33112/g.37077 Transcript_33112/m.37077 type:complete len:265 (+) Transcript_33112:103-897(+)